MPRLEQAIQLRPLAEQRRFGGVKVFWLALPDDPTTKADHDTLSVMDREHDAVAKTVVPARLAVRIALVAALDQ